MANAQRRLLKSDNLHIITFSERCFLFLRFRLRFRADHVSQNAATVTGAAERSSTSNPISNEAIADFRRRIEFLLRVVYSDEFVRSRLCLIYTAW